MTLLFLVCIIGCATIIVALVRLGFSPEFGDIAGSIVNPLVLSSFLTALFTIDFIVVYYNTGLVMFEFKAGVEPELVVFAVEIFLLFSLAHYAAARLAIASSGFRKNVQYERVFEPNEAGLWASAILFIVASGLGASSVLIYLAAQDLNSSFQIIARENPAVSIADFMQPVTLALLLAHLRKPAGPWGLLATAVTFLLTASVGGSRVVPLVCVLILVCSIPRIYTFPYWLLLVFAPFAAVFLAFLRFRFRESEGFSSFGDFLDQKGGLLNLFFGSEEVGFAKMFTSLLEVAAKMPTTPGTGILATVVYPIPRAIFPAKPLGTSAAFTDFMSPTRWVLTKSEMLVTGYGDLYLQFGILGGALALALLTYFWVRLTLLTLRGTARIYILGLPMALWLWYTFFRGDVFNASIILWSMVVELMVFAFIRFLLELTVFRPSSRSGTRMTGAEGL